MVFELLRALAEDEKGRTVVLSSHDPTAKEYAHRSCELVDGHLEDLVDGTIHPEADGHDK
jgi:putative ABC transport system ATP-binding protein